MRALVLEAPNELVLREVSDAEAGPDEVLVQVRWSGICGTDVHGYAQGEPLRHTPVVMGHEFTGTVVGSGERVVVNPRVVCNACDACASGRTQRCADARTVGVHRAGGFAEFVAVPARNCIAIPDGLDTRLAALTEPLAVGLHGANVLGAQRDLDGLRVGVIGGGIVGLGLALVAQHRGAEVTLADLAPDRRRQAQQHGIDQVADGLRGGSFDATVEAVGHRSAREASIDGLIEGGLALWIGLDAARAEIDVPHLVRGERSIVTSYCYTEAEMAEAVALCGEFDTEELEIVPMTSGTSVFERLHARGSASSARTLFAVGGE